MNEEVQRSEEQVIKSKNDRNNRRIAMAVPILVVVAIIFAIIADNFDKKNQPSSSQNIKNEENLGMQSDQSWIY